MRLALSTLIGYRWSRRTRTPGAAVLCAASFTRFSSPSFLHVTLMRAVFLRILDHSHAMPALVPFIRAPQLLAKWNLVPPCLWSLFPLSICPPCSTPCRSSLMACYPLTRGLYITRLDVRWCAGNLHTFLRSALSPAVPHAVAATNLVMHDGTDRLPII